ncbi:LLM class flavin-dependent oxidoreductase [Pontibacter sp. KCTC 32443]|uniref:LLM class flavin-dependent oxidoreductase n=1 Tax=Pontibacter TaxID=323449 RepID=UPI00164D4257|nr:MULTISPECIES: LLM class flavin-dependent oxidoreductase [Pontibacter]MBC5773690.1 LLM class flavin-dependent oxidoreductase [Pontibacter sp. KCTC 32443]
MEFGYWLPVFGGWLRNVEEESMAPDWDYVKKLAQRSEDWGYSLSLIAELFLNDIKGEQAPSLEAWSTAAALAAVTEKLEIMVAVRPTFHNPAILAKQAANIARISGDRLSLNVVSSWWKDEATKYGLHFEEHDDRYARTKEWLDIVTNVWEQDHFSYQGKYYQVENNVLQPKPKKKPFIYAGGESEAAKTLISTQCDGYVMHGDSPELIGKRIEDMKRRRDALGLPPMKFGVAAYSIVRDSDQEVKKEFDRITNVKESAAGFKNLEQWVSGTQLERQLTLQDYSVSNRGLRSGLVGTPAQVQDRIAEFEAVGVDFFLLQCSPQIEEMERFSESIINVIA